jgi:hypothetical protein
MPGSDANGEMDYGGIDEFGLHGSTYILVGTLVILISRRVVVTLC